MNYIRAYLEFRGTSIKGFGVVKKSDKSSFKYMFINDTGTMYFNNVNDHSVKNKIFTMDYLTDNHLKELI